MNQKNLNYEIETQDVHCQRMHSWAAMNQKNLNYEIETLHERPHKLYSTFPMNQKNLNYEIETLTCLDVALMVQRGYESKESQL